MVFFSETPTESQTVASQRIYIAFIQSRGTRLLTRWFPLPALNVMSMSANSFCSAGFSCLNASLCIHFLRSIQWDIFRRLGSPPLRALNSVMRLHTAFRNLTNDSFVRLSCFSSQADVSSEICFIVESLNDLRIFSSGVLPGSLSLSCRALFIWYFASPKTLFWWCFKVFRKYSISETSPSLPAFVRRWPCKISAEFFKR